MMQINNAVSLFLLCTLTCFSLQTLPVRSHLLSDNDCQRDAGKLYVKAVASHDPVDADAVPLMPNVVRFEHAFGFRVLRETNAGQLRQDLKHGIESHVVQGLYPGSAPPTYERLDEDNIQSRFVLQGRLQTNPASTKHPGLGLPIGPISARVVLTFNGTDPCLINHVEIYSKYSDGP